MIVGPLGISTVCDHVGRQEVTRFFMIASRFSLQFEGDWLKLNFLEVLPV